MSVFATIQRVMRSRARSFPLRLVTVAAAILVLPGPASAGVRPLALTPTFHPLAHGNLSEVLAGDGFVFFLPLQKAMSRGVLLNERSGKRSNVPAAPVSCFATGVIGGGWLVFNCGYVAPINVTASPKTELYSLAKKTWHVIPNPPVVQCDNDDVTCSISPVAIGKDWIEYDNTSCGLRCVSSGGAPDVYIFQNLTTGRIVTDPRKGTTIADLNTPGLSRTVCSPLQVPQVPDAYQSDGGPQPEPGTLTLDGRFAIAAGGSAHPSSSDAHRSTPIFALEKCGTHLHKRIDTAIDANFGPSWAFSTAGWCQTPVCGPASNQHLILWNSTSTRLAGLFLPSLTPFTIELPEHALDLGEILATPTHIYVLDENGNLWWANTPTKPQKTRRH